VVDLANSLVRLVCTVDKRKPDVARFHLKLGQDGLAKGFGRNSGAIGDEKNGSIWHCLNFNGVMGELRPKISLIIHGLLALINQV